MLCGLLTPDAGTGTCLGYDIIDESAAIKREVGYMTQRFSLYEDLSIRENLDFVARIYGVPQAQTGGRRARSSASASPSARASSPASCPAAGSSAWRSPPACCTSRGCCCSTSRPPASIPRRGATSGSRSTTSPPSGITVLVTTHYMDEAERCHRARLSSPTASSWSHGTVDEVIAQLGLTTFEVAGPELEALAAELRAPARRRA